MRSRTKRSTQRRCGLSGDPCLLFFLYIYIYILHCSSWHLRICVNSLLDNMRCRDFFLLVAVCTYFVIMHGDRYRASRYVSRRARDRGVPCSDRERCLLLLLCVAGCIVLGARVSMQPAALAGKRSDGSRRRSFQTKRSTEIRVPLPGRFFKSRRRIRERREGERDEFNSRVGRKRKDGANAIATNSAFASKEESAEPARDSEEEGAKIARM